LNNFKKIYFASDLHLGTPNYEESLAREKKFVAWLDEIYEDCESLFLVGDIFDFWFDYKTAVPKGFVRVLGKLASFTDKGIPVHYFKGNHDMWLNGYFEQELGFTVHEDNFSFESNGVKFLVGHGDGKGPRDFKYKILKKFFRNPICKFAFKWIHPDVGMALAQYWSRKSRYGNGETKEQFLGEDKEWLIQYIKRKDPEFKANYYIFGHRHLAIEHKINEHANYINLGDWLHFQSYAVFSGEKTELKYYSHNT
jgi:UDP-2,3-diacylglucosamine hydrolase